MRRSTLSPLLVLLASMGGVWSGCDSESGLRYPNIDPNTRISAGPPEMSDTGFNVNLFWFGWDDDGFVDHYEIAWESPDNWVTPIFTNDSLFTVAVSETCCVEPLPEFGTEYGDSIYEQFHTFFVRSVDNNGVADPSPAFRSFNSKTIAPYTRINFGPAQLGAWGTDVLFRWAGEDDDGVVVSYKIALSSLQEWRWDQNTNTNPPSAQRFVSWLDTLTYRPTATGPNFDEEVWQATDQDSFLFTSLPTTIHSPNELYLFAVRAIDNAGAEERRLDVDQNTRRFNVTSLLDGPNLTLVSNIAGTWSSGAVQAAREVFKGQGLRFRWRGTPGASGTEIAGFSFAIDDTTNWSPFSLNSEEWPDQPSDPEDPENLWFPESGPHSFFLRGIDLGGFIRVLAADIRVFDGPRFCDEDQTILLVVLDTNTSSLVGNSFWPTSYPAIERALIDAWFAGYDYQVHETRAGRDDPPVALMNCASSIFWFHSADAAGNDISTLLSYHTEPPNPLPSYIASGGNLFLCGLAPSNAMRFYENAESGSVNAQDHPLLFFSTVDDPDLVPHWGATHLGVARISGTVENPTGPSERLRLAKSLVPEYPDLPFDPLTWPLGSIVRGFGYYDEEVIPLTGDPRFRDAEAIYGFNSATGAPLAVRRLTQPGINGNVVYLGFHPYFVDRQAARELIVAVLEDFGEDPIPGS